MNSQSLRWRIVEATATVVIPTVIMGAAWYVFETYYGTGPLGRATPKLSEASRALLAARGHDAADLTEHEVAIAAELIRPEDIDVDFSHIGGLDPIIASLRESVIYPLLYPHLFGSSSLLSAPKGVLLHGPPGCGKTLLAKALAREGGAAFLNVRGSALASKWYGETNKLVAAVFALARRCQPAIVFLDEIDAFLRERSAGDHEASAMMKAEFMTLWDGLTTSSDRIVVLGATNRMEDIDAAFLRRMPARFAIGLPDALQRAAILRLLLADVPLAPDTNIDVLARATPTLSGSDLRELCRTAALRGMRGALAALPPGELAAHTELVMRPLTLVDFVDALRAMLATRAAHEGVDRQAWRGGNPFAARAPAEDRSRLDEEDEETVVDKVVGDAAEERVVELD